MYSCFMIHIFHFKFELYVKYLIPICGKFQINYPKPFCPIRKNTERIKLQFSYRRKENTIDNGLKIHLPN